MNKLKAIGFSLKDVIYAVALIVGLSVRWGSLPAKVAALEEQVKPIPQMHTEIEVVKAAILDIKEGFKELRQDIRRRR